MRDVEIEIKRDREGVRYVRPYLGTNKVTGRPIRPYHRFPQAESDEEALELARAWLAEIAPAADVGVTHRVGDLLARYVRWAEENGKSANTVKTYRSLSRHAGPIAAMPARSVRARDLERLYHRLLTPRPEGSGLSATTVIAFHWFLSGAFGWMARIGAVDANPAAAAEPPSPEAYEAVALEAEDFAALSAMLAAWPQMPAGTPHELLRREAAFGAHLALNTGLRCGEVCALRRSDAQLVRRNLHVGGTVVEARGRVFRQATTKGRKRRNVAVTAELCDAIREHEATFGRVRGAKAPLVCCGDGWVRPSALSAAFGELARECGMPSGTTFHSLRHTHATWLLLQGVDVKTVSERLGHSSVSTTLAIYAHVLPGRDALAAEAFERAAHGAAEW